MSVNRAKPLFATSAARRSSAPLSLRRSTHKGPALSGNARLLVASPEGPVQSNFVRFWLVARLQSKWPSGSRLPAAVSASASLNSPCHSGSAVHTSAWLRPLRFNSECSPGKDSCDTSVHLSMHLPSPRSARSPTRDILLMFSVVWPTSGKPIGARPSPLSPPVVRLLFLTALIRVRTILPPIPDSCSTAP